MANQCRRCNYPTDLSLLNEAREFSEQIIDKLYPKTDWKNKPRTYRVKARKAYLAVAKQRRPLARFGVVVSKSSCSICVATWGTLNVYWNTGRKAHRCLCLAGYYITTG